MSARVNSCPYTYLARGPLITKSHTHEIPKSGSIVRRHPNLSLQLTLSIQRWYSGRKLLKINAALLGRTSQDFLRIIFGSFDLCLPLVHNFRTFAGSTGSGSPSILIAGDFS
jgi:hypothetical protein